MKKYVLLSLILGFSLWSCEQPGKSNTNSDWLCVLGKRVGKITASTTEKDLKEYYGEANVVRDSLHIGEGEYVGSTKVFPNTKNQLNIAWKEGQEYKKIARVIVDQVGTQWITNNGITVGTDLNKLTEINQVPFTFFGFEWDYSGNVANWEGGELDGKNFGLRLHYTADMNEIPEKERLKVIGDQEVSSEEGVLQKMNVRVQNMFFVFN